MLLEVSGVVLMCNWVKSLFFPSCVTAKLWMFYQMDSVSAQESFHCWYFNSYSIFPWQVVTLRCVLFACNLLRSYWSISFFPLFSNWEDKSVAGTDVSLARTVQLIQRTQDEAVLWVVNNTHVVFGPPLLRPCCYRDHIRHFYYTVI